MFWTCNHCDSVVEEKLDYCPTCEELGCTANNHKCAQDDK
jgi:RNA polymerase subunit RPABC4/transcription elongation factor Spt4